MISAKNLFFITKILIFDKFIMLLNRKKFTQKFFISNINFKIIAINHSQIMVRFYNYYFFLSIYD